LLLLLLLLLLLKSETLLLLLPFWGFVRAQCCSALCVVVFAMVIRKKEAKRNERTRAKEKNVPIDKM